MASDKNRTDRFDHTADPSATGKHARVQIPDIAFEPPKTTTAMPSAEQASSVAQRGNESPSGYRPAQDEASAAYLRGNDAYRNQTRMVVPGGSGKRASIDLGPKRRSSTKLIAGIVAAVLVLLVVLVSSEIMLNNNKVHQGVKVQGVSIGGMDRATATDTLRAALDTKLETASVKVVPGAAVEKRLEENTVDDVASAPDSDAPTEDVAGEGQTGSTSELAWAFSAEDLGASVDVEALVNAAYGVGEISGLGDFFPGVSERFGSWIGRVDIPATVSYDQTVLASSLKAVDAAIGIEMQNCGIVIDVNGVAGIVPGRIGERVDPVAFGIKAGPVLLGAVSTPFDAPLVEIPLAVDEAEAQVVAAEISTAISEPVSFIYGESSWEIWAPMLGSWTKTEVQGEGDDAKLVAHIDAALAYNGLQQLMGDVGYGTAKNATFDVSSGTPAIVGGTAGRGPDIKTAMSSLEKLLYGSGGAGRTIVLEQAEVEPEVSATDAAAMGVSELITTFKLGYGSGGGSNREFNIEKCLDVLNGSLVAPGAHWNWNEILGNCDEVAGYKDASVIVNNKIEQSAGGGICNVATGVFNAAYEAGLPVIERTNHSKYQPNYPLGRDAAVSWEYPTLVFKNDTEKYFLVTASYDGTDMSISIWGTNPHRTVESKNSDWADTSSGGKSITNYRTVKSADGTVLWEDSFYSYFPPSVDE